MTNKPLCRYKKRGCKKWSAPPKASDFRGSCHFYSSFYWLHANKFSSFHKTYLNRSFVMPLFFQKRFDRFPYDLRLRNAFADTFSLEFLDHIFGQTSRYCAVCLCVIASLDSRRGFCLTLLLFVHFATPEPFWIYLQQEPQDWELCRFLAELSYRNTKKA